MTFLHVHYKYHASLIQTGVVYNACASGMWATFMKNVLSTHLTSSWWCVRACGAFTQCHNPESYVLPLAVREKDQATLSLGNAKINILTQD